MLGIAVIEAGTIDIEFNSSIEKLQKDQLVIFNPHVIHCSKNTQDKVNGYNILYINVDWCQSIQQNIFHNNSHFINLNRNIIDDKETYNIFLSLFKEVFNDSSNKHYEDTISQFISELFKNYCSVKQITNNNKEKQNPIATTVKEYILNNIDQDITLDDLSKYTGYNGTYLIRVFKNQFGLTPKALIINQKINRAKKLLLENKELNLVDIALEAGFYDQSHFIKSFKRVFAVSPSIYKKSLP